MPLRDTFRHFFGLFWECLNSYWSFHYILIESNFLGFHPSLIRKWFKVCSSSPPLYPLSDKILKLKPKAPEYLFFVHFLTSGLFTFLKQLLENCALLGPLFKIYWPFLSILIESNFLGFHPSLIRKWFKVCSSSPPLYPLSDKILKLKPNVTEYLFFVHFITSALFAFLKQLLESCALLGPLFKFIGHFFRFWLKVIFWGFILL